MFNNLKNTSYCAISLTAFSLTISLQVWAKDHIRPSMINIPAGSFIMGNNFGNDKAKPAHKVTLPEFQMAKYPVTVAEFRKFAEDTGFNPEPSCSDYIGSSWFNSPKNAKNTATWDKHRFQNNDYQPVTCITWTEANEYAQWLSKKTGVNYRLPTEQEFEYALKAGTTSRYFWGDDENMTLACQYGNFADRSGEHIANLEYGASYVGFLNIANCDDGEAYNSIVGLYRPNPFGLYDMVGNVSQYLSTCYYEGYQARSEEDMDNTKCEYIAHRGSTWHFPPQPHADRGRAKRLDETEWALMGFRLASDGHSTDKNTNNASFESKLKLAQDKHFQSRKMVIAKPLNVHMNKGKNGQQTLNWQASYQQTITNYDIYQSTSQYAHLLGGFYQKHYEKFMTVEGGMNSVSLPSSGLNKSYRVVARMGKQSSLPSQAVFTKRSDITDIPGKLNMQSIQALSNVYLSHRPAREDKPELYYLSRFHPGYTQPTISANFTVNVEKSGWYSVNYRGRNGHNGEFFKLWSGKVLLGSIYYDKDIDDKSSNRHKVYLEKGLQDFQINLMQEGFNFWSLVWLELNEIES